MGAIPELIEAVGDRDPAGNACVIAGGRQCGDALGNMLSCLFAKASLDGEGFGPAFLLRRHSSVAAVDGADRALFHGSLVRSMAISSSGKQRS